MSQPYAKAMAMRPALLYTPYATSSSEQTGDIITFTQFEEENLWYKMQNLLYEACDDMESSNESDEDSTMLPLISEE